MQQDLNGPQGETGATGTGVGSITKQFYLSTSKTEQTGGSWVETMPTWVNGKYLWTRDKIVYTNPASTKYTTPIVSSEWEAVNELNIGGRNYYLKSNTFTAAGSGAAGITPSIENGLWKIVVASGNGNWHSWTHSNLIEDNFEEGDDFVFSFEIKSADATTTTPPKIYFKNGMGYYETIGKVSSEWSRVYYTGAWKDTNPIATHFGWSGLVGTYYIRKLKFEAGNTPTDWSPAPEDSTNSIYVVGTQTAAGATWTGKTDELIELTAGTQILYKLPYAGAANVTLNLTLANGTTTGAKNCYYKYNSTRLSTQYPANSTISMLYDGTQWIVTNPYTNDNTYDRTRYNNNIKAAAAITADRLIVGTSAGYVTAAAGISFDINYPVLWASSAIAAAGIGSNNYLTLPSKNLRNNKSGITLTIYKMAYLKGTLSGNIFTIDTAVFSNEPSTEDGKYYIPIGILYSEYQVYFDCGMPTVYKYYDGAFRPLPRT